MKNRKQDKKKIGPVSERQVIEERARRLPIHKCYISGDWNTTKMAHVIVSRKHVNGNITAGIYLVDLLCLGVKDTFFLYNEPEENLKERLGRASGSGIEFEEVEYELAHNVVYAGHDFAMEFEIYPAAGFQVTKYILEDDSDEVKLIDIAVGDEDGKPMLLVANRGEESVALRKLQLHAGEGNYTYITRSELYDEYGEDDDDDDDDDEEVIDAKDIPVGALGPYEAARLKSSDLLDKELLDSRDESDRLSMQVALLARLTDGEFDAFDESYFKELDWLANAVLYPAYFDEVSTNEWKLATDNRVELIKKGISLEELSVHLKEEIYIYRHNLLIVAEIYGYAVSNAINDIADASCVALQNFTDTPLAKLYLSLGALLEKENADAYENMFEEPDIFKLFPAISNFCRDELQLFWLAKIVWYIEKDDLKQVIRYYHLLTNLPLLGWLMVCVQTRLRNYLVKYWNEQSKNVLGDLE